jgi:septum formation protein
VVVPDVEELREGPPEELVVENALRKARSGLAVAGAGRPVLGVDTDVLLDGRTLGKADDEAQARDRLGALSGRTHEVLSGLALVVEGTEARTALARTEVTFRELEPETIELYLRSGEWRDRAGAYAIQGLGSILVERLEGDFSNVVGLPVATLLQLAPELMEYP